MKCRVLPQELEQSHAWRRRRTACALDDQLSCPRISAHRLTPSELRVIEDVVTSPEYRHVPTGTLAVLAQRPGTVWASASNSMIEAWWRSLKHQWLFLHSLDGVTTVCRLVEFYVDEHNRVLPHSAFRGKTPDEMYFGTGDTVPADLTSGAAAARRARAEANRSSACETCPSLDTVA